MQEISERMEFTDFVKFPRTIITDNTLSVSARLLYVILFERISLSQSNPRYRETDGTVFCLFKQEDIAAIMRKDVKSVRSYMRELETVGLLRKVSPGRKKLDRLYLRIPDSSIKLSQKSPPEYTETMEDKLVVVYDTARKAGFKVDAAFSTILREKVEAKNAPTVIAALKFCEHHKKQNLVSFLAVVSNVSLQEDKPVSNSETTLIAVLENAEAAGMRQGEYTEREIKRLVKKYGATAVYYKITECALNCQGEWGVNYLETALRNLTQ